MGAFQANILEATKCQHEDFQKSLQKTSSQVEVDQTSSSCSKSGTSNVPLDPPSTNTVKSMDVDYGPALPPRLNSYARCVNGTSGQHFSSVEEPSRLPSTKLKNSILWPGALPRTTTLINLKTLDLPLAGLKIILI